MPHNIDYNNDFIERQTEGFAFSADEINPAASLKMPQNHRMDIARPVVIANNLEIPDGPDADHNALPIKNTDSMIVALPECYSFAVAMAKLVSDDLLSLYGKNKFRSLKLSFILQRTDFEPQTAHRPNFANWHTHNHGRTSLDLTYQFTSALGTEFKHDLARDKALILNAPINALTRFGSEIPHRSPQNHTNTTMRRSWGAFLVYERSFPTNNEVYNRILQPENINRALEKSTRLTTQELNVFDTPIALTSYAHRFLPPHTTPKNPAINDNNLKSMHNAIKLAPDDFSL